MIKQGRALLDEAAQLQRPGPYQTLAAIHLTHARRIDGGETDWRAILRLYDALLVMRPGALAQINRALALAQIEGVAAGLASLDGIDAAKLAQHRPLFTARASLLEQAGRVQEAAEMLEQALETAPDTAELLFLEKWQQRLSRP